MVTQQIESRVSRAAAQMAVIGFLLAAVAGLVLGVAISTAGDTLIGWVTFLLAVLVGCIWAFMLMWRALNHQAELENTVANIAVTRANAEWAKTQPQPTTNFFQPPPQQAQLPPPPPRPAPKLVETQTRMNWQKFVLPEAEPEDTEEDADLSDWPDDVEALRAAHRLMCEGRLPTRKNFDTAGLKSGSRYENIRAWLVGAGLAQDAGDGNPTLWTQHSKDQTVRETIRKFLNSPTAAE